MNIELQKLLLEHHDNVQFEQIQKSTVKECIISSLQLRDCLHLLGTILYEDLENGIYVAYVRAGFGNLSGATVAMQLSENTLHIAGYAKEGIVKQRVCETAILRIKNAALGEKIADSSKFPRCFRILLTILTVIVLLSVRGCVLSGIDSDMVTDTLTSNSQVTPDSSSSKETDEELAFKQEVQQAIQATKNYNNAVKQFNLAVGEYNLAVALACIDNISGLPDRLETLALESEVYEDIAEVLQNETTRESIEADTVTVKGMEQQVKEMISIVNQITVPTHDWISDRLKRVDNITESQAVTADNDPDNLLDKEGGFTDCVYFTVKEIDANSVPGKDTVGKGTDAGGAVEVYASKEEATARCDYLAGFDDTVLYSGSYAIVGTMVIRTSYKLTNQQQVDLTSAITSALLELN